MRALVISGGGCKGAWAGGVAEHLIKERGINYDIFVGSSTGALLIPHLAIGRIDKIKGLYTSVCQKDIYTVNPFIIKPCLLYTSPSPRDATLSRMPSSA